MTLPPPPIPYVDQEAKDRSNLRLLSVLHYVFAAMQVLFGLGAVAYGLFGLLVIPEMMDEMAQQQAQRNPQAPPPPAFMRSFGLLYAFLGGLGALLCFTQAVLSLLAGRAFGVPRSRGLCIAASAAACIMFPFGTALGVVSLVVLARPSVERRFEESRRG